ncbi:MAG: S41 family peptidase, partial [Spartobacteria bacterium]
MRWSLKILGVAVLATHSLAQESPPKSDEQVYEQLQLLARTMQLIRQDYVDESKTSYTDLAHNALRGMLNELDPHSQFMDAKNFKTMQEDTRSEFGGLGVVVTERSGVLTVINPMEDTPGFKAGLLPGDQILKING